MAGNRRVGMVLQERDRRLLEELAVMRVVDREQAQASAGLRFRHAGECAALGAYPRGTLATVFPRASGAGQKALYTFSAAGAQLVGASIAAPTPQG